MNLQPGHPFWRDTCENLTSGPSLEGEHHTDVAIVGGGFTGLWSAYFLKELDPSLKVTLVEQEMLGYGASGRNGGMVCSSIAQSHALGILHYGLEDARTLARLGIENVNELGEFAADCDFEKTGTMFVALSPQHLETYAASLESAKLVGDNGYRLMSAQEVRSELHSALYVGGAFSENEAIVNPLKIVWKLGAHARSAGVEIFENSPVKRIEGSTVHTASGVVRAKRVILATDAYSHYLFPQLKRRFVPVYDYITVSEPLTQGQMDLIGWKHRQGVNDARTFFNYYRLTHDNRILWGTSEAMYYPPNSVNSSHDYSESHYLSLKQAFVRHFPQLVDLRFPYIWGGPIASTTRLSACFGKLEGGDVAYALGYTGQGIAASRFAGKILAHMTLDRPSPLLELGIVRKKPFPFPPGPFRTMAIRAVTRGLRAVDNGAEPSRLLRLLDKLGIEFSS